MNKIKKFLSDNSLDGFLVSKPENITWLTGFEGSFGMVLVQKIIPQTENSPLTQENTSESGIPPSPPYQGGKASGSCFRGDLYWGGVSEEDVLKKGLILNRGFLPYNPKLKDRARELRKNMTEPEKKMWYEVLKKIPGKNFLRQRPIDDFIVDFYCPELQLVIEIDGDSHAGKKSEICDEERTKILEGYGLTVFRYWNNEIMNNPEGVFDDLVEKIEGWTQKIISQTESSPLTPLKEGGSSAFENDFEKRNGGSEIRKFLITDARYEGKAKDLCENSDTGFVLFNEHFSESFAEKISGKIGIEDSITLRGLKNFKKWFKNAELVEQSSVFETFRSVKNAEEIQKTQIAAAHVDRGLRKVSGILKTGITEKEVCYKLENMIRDNGKFGIAFDSIVAFGEHSAIPHHSPTDRKLKKNEPVLIDCGAVYKGYHSDITRNFWFGDRVDPEYKDSYEQLLKIQSEANTKCVVGAKTSDIDGFVRASLGKSQEFFTHSLGHGTGLEIHELPNLSSKSEAVLEEGNIITCEPGLYFPGKWGIRIEDQLVVGKIPEKNILTNFSKELILIKH